MASASPDGSAVMLEPLGVFKVVMRISRLFFSKTREGMFNSFTRGFMGGMSSSAPYLRRVSNLSTTSHILCSPQKQRLAILRRLLEHLLPLTLIFKRIGKQDSGKLPCSHISILSQS